MKNLVSYDGSAVTGKAIALGLARNIAISIGTWAAFQIGARLLEKKLLKP